jgi:hypothetical protein
MLATLLQKIDIKYGFVKLQLKTENVCAEATSEKWMYWRKSLIIKFGKGNLNIELCFKSTLLVCTMWCNDLLFQLIIMKENGWILNEGKDRKVLLYLHSNSSKLHHVYQDS